MLSIFSRTRDFEKDPCNNKSKSYAEYGNTCKPTAVSFQCMTKSTTNLKKKRKKKEIHLTNEVKILMNKKLF